MSEYESVTADTWQDAERMHYATVAYFDPGPHSPDCKADDPRYLCRCPRADRLTWQAVAAQHGPEGLGVFVPCAEHAAERTYHELRNGDCAECKRIIRLVCASPCCTPYWPCLTAARLIECAGMNTPEAVDAALTGQVSA